MKILTWSLRLFIFLFLFSFALQNTETVSLRFLLNLSWQAPLALILLAFFAAGALLGVASLLGLVFRQRREIARLNRVVQEAGKPAVAEPPIAP